MAATGAGVAMLLVRQFPQAFGVIVEDGSLLPLLGILLISAAGLAESVAQRKEEGIRNA
jgi:hypothetical protein